MKLLPLLFLSAFLVCGQQTHLENIRQLTHGGQNAEAYWAPDGKRLVFQSTRPGYDCDQIFTLDVDAPKAEPLLVSSGKGRTTCAYFFPGKRRILYSSTEASGPRCPPPPDRSHGYVWGLFDYDVITANADGSDRRRLTQTPGYDADTPRRRTRACPVDHETG